MEVNTSRAEGLTRWAESIAQHYMPRGKDEIPSKGAPSIVALADKLEHARGLIFLGTR